MGKKGGTFLLPIPEMEIKILMDPVFDELFP
jgi:hypothetical protein